MARSSWQGPIIFSGFPIPVKAYNLIASASRESFKTVCTCHGQPITQTNLCSVTQTAVTDTRKAAVGAGKALTVLDDRPIQTVKSAAVEPEKVCPLSTLDLTLTSAAYRLVPDTGADKPVAVLWATLRKTNRALVSRWVLRANSRDAIIAIHAAPDGLRANVLPYQAQLSDAPTSNTPSIAVSDAEMAMFEQAMGALYANEDFNRTAFASEWARQREAAIAAASGAAPVAAAPAGAPDPVVPDLMAALRASLNATKVAA